VIERRTQAAMIIIFECNESKRLQNSVERFSHGGENFSHAVYRPGLSLKRNFDEVTFCQRLCQPEQASGHGNGLEFRLGAPAIFQPDRSQNGISKLYPGRAARGMGVGEVSHMSTALWHDGGIA
jgi:hypothetical protein